jgi:hypothetical protein
MCEVDGNKEKMCEVDGNKEKIVLNKTMEINKKYRNGNVLTPQIYGS